MRAGPKGEPVWKRLELGITPVLTFCRRSCPISAGGAARGDAPGTEIRASFHLSSQQQPRREAVQHHLPLGFPGSYFAWKRN